MTRSEHEFIDVIEAENARLRADLAAVDAALWPNGRQETYAPDRALVIATRTKLTAEMVQKLKELQA